MDHIDSLGNLCDEVDFCQQPTVEYMKKGEHSELSSETMIGATTMLKIQLR